MRYVSSDCNCCISLQEPERSSKDEAGQTVVLADIAITHPCLVSIRKTPAKDGFVLRSKLSGRDVCSFPRADIGLEGGRRMDLEKLQGLHVTLLQDAEPEEKVEASAKTPFEVIIPHNDCSTTSTSDKMQPDIETLLMDVITRRKVQDDAEIREFVKGKQAEYTQFEAEVKTQANILSDLVKESSNKKGAFSEDLPTRSTHTSTRRSSENSSQSASSSTSIEGTRKRWSHKTKKRTPVRSATTPVPKSALSTPRRKTSTHESSTESGGLEMPAKRVMFSELEPTRIDSPHVLELSDAEDYVAPRVDGEQDDLFDMDEQIPVVPIDEQVPPPIDVPGTGSIEIPNRGQPFGRQADDGIPGSFALRSLVKYGADSMSPVEDTTSLKRLEISDAEGSPFATSLPRSISRPAPAPMPAPLFSVKDIPALSPATTDSEFDTSGDEPPKGVSRKKMWRQAVASSMRMSGIVMPGLTGTDDLDPAFFRASMSGQSLRS